MMLDRYDTGDSFWIGIGLLSFIVISIISYKFTGIIITAVFLYYVTRPLFKYINSKLERRRLSAGLTILLSFIPFFMIAVYSILIGYRQFTDAIREYNLGNGELFSFSQLQTNISFSSYPGPEQFQQNGELNVEMITEVILEIIRSIGFFGNFLISFLLLITLVFYLLKEDYRISGWMDYTFGPHIPKFDRYKTVVDRDLKIIFFGNILTMIIIGVATSIIYFSLNFLFPEALDIPYPFLIGILCGIASIIPFIGMKIVYVPLTAYMSFNTITSGYGAEALWIPALVFVVSAVLIDTIPELLLRPYMSQEDIHLGLVILAYVLGPLTFGWYGLFLGPFILVFMFHFFKEILPYLIEKQDTVV